jgi:hypothetical protein
VAEQTEQETIASQYDLIRALVARFGPDIWLTKEEFLASCGGHLTIQIYEEHVILRVWNKGN